MKTRPEQHNLEQNVLWLCKLFRLPPVFHFLIDICEYTLVLDGYADSRFTSRIQEVKIDVDDFVRREMEKEGDPSFFY